MGHENTRTPTHISNAPYTYMDMGKQVIDINAKKAISGEHLMQLDEAYKRFDVVMMQS